MQPSPKNDRLKILTERTKSAILAKKIEGDQIPKFIEDYCITQWSLGYHTVNDYKKLVDARLGRDPEVLKALEL